MAGRPTSLTPKVQADIVEAVRAGNYRTTAAAKVGVHRNTMLNWMTWGAEGKPEYVEFFAAVEQAEAESEAELVADVRHAKAAVVGLSGPDLWQARMTLLERRFPHRWSARVRTTVDEELGALMKRLEERLDEGTYEKVLNAAREDAPGEGADTPRH